MTTKAVDTIVALASGALPSGVAIIRISGPMCFEMACRMFSKPLEPRKAVVREVRHPVEKTPIDKGLALYFPGPGSYTGEDVLELHVHGGRAVVSALLDACCSVPDVRLAEAGEFSRRAFENGRLDLTEVDGIADLVASETESQRRLALSQSQGSLRSLYDGWRSRLVYIRSLVEAEFDFSDEEDVPEEISEEGFRLLGSLIEDMESHLEDGRVGEIIRDGYRISLIGKPNIGKSSLLNMLAKRDVSIVTDEAGTTRDVLDVSLDISGYQVIVSDTAGIRDAESKAEREGVKRAQERAERSDLVLVLVEEPGTSEAFYSGSQPVLEVVAKDDGGLHEHGSVSSKTGHGVDWLLGAIETRLKNLAVTANEGLITRKRYRDGLMDALSHLNAGLVIEDGSPELKAEELRIAGDCIGRITGKIDVEDLLDVIFSEFCVGK